MFIYLFIDIAIIMLSLLLIKQKRICNIQLDREPTRLRETAFYLSIFLLLFFVSSFRGDFTSDYTGYEEIYFYFRQFSLSELITQRITYPEKGYLIIQYFIKSLTHNVLFVFIISSAIIVYAHLKQIKQSSISYVALAILLFVELGNYYISFNLVRQVLSASIVLLGSNYLYKRKTLKFIIIILIASTIHTTALIMIPCYFLLNIKFKKKSFLVYSIVIVSLVIFLPDIIQFVQLYKWQQFTEEHYGMIGYNFKNVIAPLAISLYSIIHMLARKEHVFESDILEDRKINIWHNSTYLYLTTYILGLSVEMLQRFSVFFSLYAVILFVKTIERGKYSRYVKLLVILITILYGLIAKDGTAFNPFYFIWNR